jgi:hypothetical protein
MAPQTVKRTKTRQLRLTPGEDTKIAEDAKAAGLEFSEFVRRQCGIANYGRSSLRRQSAPKPTVVPAAPAPPSSDRQRRVNEAARRMPRRTAEQVVRKEEMRERAKAS